MTEFDKYRKLILGKTLTNLYFTRQNGPYDYLPGIFPAYYFSTIMELDGSTKLRFGNNFIIEWKDEEQLTALTNEYWGLPKTLTFKGQKITELTIETKDEYEQLTFYLENGTTIAHTIDYGDQLFIKNPTITEDKEHNLDRHTTSPNRILSNSGQKWWRKLFGFK